jgi:hypothetical protein
MNAFARADRRHSHPLVHRIPQILELAGLISIVRTIGFRRSARLVEAAAALYVQDRKRARRS